MFRFKKTLLMNRVFSIDFYNFMCYGMELTNINKADVH